MSKILTPFERHLKEKIADYEMPYEQRSWFALQKTMSLANAGNYPWLVALVATVLVTAGGSIGLYRNQHTPASGNVVITETRFDNPIQISQMISSASALNLAEYEKAKYNEKKSSVSPDNGKSIGLANVDTKSNITSKESTTKTSIATCAFVRL